MKTNSIKEVKNIFKSNFTKLLDGKYIELNAQNIKIMASYEDGEGGFCEPEVILNAFDNKFDEEAINNMLQQINDEYLEVDCKQENDDYVITAGNNENVYVIKLQIFRIK